MEFNSIVFAYKKDNDQVFCRILTVDELSIEKNIEEVFTEMSFEIICTPITIKVYILVELFQDDKKLIAYIFTIKGKNKIHFFDEFFNELEDPKNIEEMFIRVKKVAENIVIDEDTKKKLN